MNTADSSLLITWRDVEHRLGRRGPSTAWQLAQVDLFGVTVYTDDEDAARREFSARVGPAYDQDADRVALLAAGLRPRHLPVSFYPAAEAPPPPPRVVRPLWSSGPVDAPELPTREGCSIAAFFSFKGGVGRTTSCYATLLRLLDREDPARVLYVDADVEAPGLTWFVQASERLSWVDALALVHDSDDWEADALPVVASQLVANPVGLELSSGRREFFLLPAVRDFAQVENLPAVPEQLVRRRGRAWVITDLLVKLAEKLKLDAVLVDLRAGMTEFSSPLMLDPRVRNVLVTSCARQSVLGTVRALTEVEARTRWSAALEVVVTKVPRDGDSAFAEVNRQVDLAWADSGEGKSAAEDPAPPVVHRVDFSEALLVFDDLQRVADRLPSTMLWAAAEGIAEALVSAATDVPSNQPPAEVTKDRIASLARALEFAEENAELGLLPTPALQQLVRLPPGQLPASVVLGSKGAGKTFTWGQLVTATTLSAFRDAVGVAHGDAVDAKVFPLLFPAHLGSEIRVKAREAEQSVRPAGSVCRLTPSELGEALQRGDAEREGLSFWTQAVADRLGWPVEAGSSVRSLEQYLATRGERMVLVLDGLEDALQVGPQAPMSESQRVLLRALLVDFVNQLRDLGPRHLGLIVFIRRDLARSAIPQNFGQFEARHQQVALRWSPADALRLTLWLLDRAGWPLLPADKVTTAPYETLAESLHPYWNEKLGGGQREAYSDRWVVAALSDLNGRFQARDLVRLVHFATNHSDGFPISRSAMHSAIEECSKKKVEELQTEVTQLQPVFKALKEIDGDKRTIPIRGDVLPLEDDDIEFLVQEGLLYFEEKEGQYYMPEIIRFGLDFGLARRGRARVLSLQRAAQRRR